MTLKGLRADCFSQDLDIDRLALGDLDMDILDLERVLEGVI